MNGTYNSSNRFSALSTNPSSPASPSPAPSTTPTTRSSKPGPRKKSKSPTETPPPMSAHATNGHAVGNGNGYAKEANGVVPQKKVEQVVQAVEEVAGGLRTREKRLEKEGAKVVDSTKERLEKLGKKEQERLGKIDWEIPRKTLHSSIGFLALFLYYLNPPNLRPLLTFLSTGLAIVGTVDIFRLNFPAFARVYESVLGPLMRDEEKKRINGVIWYLIGVIFVLGVYPRDVAVVSILTLSWSDTTASTIGRLLGPHSPPLPSHVPLLPFLPFARRKSLAGFSAAVITGFCIGVGFWWRGSFGHWAVIDGAEKAVGWGRRVGGRQVGMWVTSGVLGVGGAVVEALDLGGLDDNLTLPILTGAIIWFWLSITSYLS